MARFGLGVSLLLVASFALSQQSQVPKFHSVAASGLSMPMVAPLFLEDGDFSRAVTLVNDAIDPMQARVVVLDANGLQVAYKELQLPGHTSLSVELHDLLTEALGVIRPCSVELQAKDNDSPQNGGGHPWSIEPGTTSTVLLFNHSTNGPKRFNVNIGSGAQTWQRSYQLAFMETCQSASRPTLNFQ